MAEDAYDVYISCAPADGMWAQRLAEDVSAFGLRCFWDEKLRAGDVWSDDLRDALDRSRSLVVIWSPEAVDSGVILAEIEAFGARQPLLPLVLGGDEARLPQLLRTRTFAVVGREAYAAGADAPSDEWTDAVELIERALVKSPPPAAEALPPFSTGARRALTYAGAIGSDFEDEGRLRAAALLGALRASAQRGMTPSTGDVVRLALDRQKTARTAEQMLDAAARAGGLSQLGEEWPQALDAEELVVSHVGGLVRDAVEMQRRTGADSVHLRHVLATGVHPAVPAAVLAELGVTLDDIRWTWRASIGRTWPDESGEGWDAILTPWPLPSDAGRAILPGYAADTLLGEDLLGFKDRVRFLSSVLAAKDLETPLAIGVFGDWGSGKSFFMRRLQEGIAELVDASAQALKGGRPTAYCSQIRQVTFNAWLYSGSDMWPSLAAQVFRSVSGEEPEAPQSAIQVAALQGFQDEAAKRLRGLTARQAEADATLAALDARIDDVTGELAKKRAELADQAAVLGPEARTVAGLASGAADAGRRLARIRKAWRVMGAWERVTVVAVLVVGMAVAVLTAVDKAWLGSAISILAPVGVVIAVLRPTLRYLDATAGSRLEIEQLEARLRELEDAREEHLARRTSAEAEVEQFRARPLLRDFAADQAQRWLERERPGKITEIRLRFEQLSTLITENLAARESGGATAADVPPIERVVVYIDDLDRCQWPVVVKVLEAIKLLLAVPHFVVIVGVDSRWLFQSLVKRFAQMQGDDGAGRVTQGDDGAGRVTQGDDGAGRATQGDDGAGRATDSTRSTPQNYLEKIFQYSLVLPPMSDKGFGRLVERLLSPAEKVKPDGDKRSASAATKASDVPQRSEAPDAATPAPATPQGDALPTPPQTAVDATPSTASSEHAAPPPATLDLTPADLTISPDEVVAMTALAPLFDTPRAAKRLTNLYRLIRVAVGADELLEDVAYQPLMVLLAASLARPNEAVRLFAAVQTDRDNEWGLLLKERPPAVGALRTELVKVTDMLSMGPRPLHRREVREFARWVPVVAEFSFHPWRTIVPASAAPADGQR